MKKFLIRDQTSVKYISSFYQTPNFIFTITRDSSIKCSSSEGRKTEKSEMVVIHSVYIFLQIIFTIEFVKAFLLPVYINYKLVYFCCIILFVKWCQRRSEPQEQLENCLRVVKIRGQKNMENK